MMTAFGLNYKRSTVIPWRKLTKKDKENTKD